MEVLNPSTSQGSDFWFFFQNSAAENYPIICHPYLPRRSSVWRSVSSFFSNFRFSGALPLTFNWMHVNHCNDSIDFHMNFTLLLIFIVVLLTPTFPSVLVPKNCWERGEDQRPRTPVVILNYLKYSDIGFLCKPKTPTIVWGRGLCTAFSNTLLRENWWKLWR